MKDMCICCMDHPCASVALKRGESIQCGRNDHAVSPGDAVLPLPGQLSQGKGFGPGPKDKQV